MRIAVFATCLGDALFPQAPIATVELLERLGHEVVFPADQTCCGQMHVNTGYLDAALPLVRHHVSVFDGAADVGDAEDVDEQLGELVGAVRELLRGAGEALVAAAARDHRVLVAHAPTHDPEGATATSAAPSNTDTWWRTSGSAASR